MTTPTDPTTLRTALEALVGLVDCYGLDHYGGDWGCAECHPDSDMLVGGFQCGLHLARAVLATPAPAADEARCDGSHDFLPLTCSRCGVRGTLNLSIVGEDERLDITKTHPDPTPVPPTPPATGTVERCAECGGVKDDVFHVPCLVGGPFHYVKTCHPFTPPAPEPSAALVEAHRMEASDPQGPDPEMCVVCGQGWGAHVWSAPLAAARAEGLDGLTVAMVADAIHPEGQGPTIDCCMGSTVESLYPPDEAARLHRKHHEEAATRFLAYLAARARRAGEERA